MGIHDACPKHEEAYRICGCKEKHDCYVCGGEGWLPSKPEGNSECHYCNGTGKTTVSPFPSYISDPDPEFYGGPDYDLARDMDRGK